MQSNDVKGRAEGNKEHPQVFEALQSMIGQ